MIYQTTSDGVFSKDFGLRDQIRRSGVSIVANIAEGFGRRSDKEFANFLNIAHGSAAETQSHLYIAADLGYVNQEIFNDLYEKLDEISRMIMSFLNICDGLRFPDARRLLALQPRDALESQDPRRLLGSPAARCSGLSRRATLWTL